MFAWVYNVQTVRRDLPNILLIHQKLAIEIKISPFYPDRLQT